MLVQCTGVTNRKDYTLISSLVSIYLLAPLQEKGQLLLLNQNTQVNLASVLWLFSKLHNFFLQPVPSEVTGFDTGAVSPNELIVSWNLPAHLNGILTGYKIVIFNLFFNYSISVFVPETFTDITFANGIGKHYLLQIHL